MARKKKLDPTHPNYGKEQFSYGLLRRYQNGCCFYCDNMIGRKPWTPDNQQGYTRDHFFPVSYGHTLACNVVLACRDCNSRKGNDLPGPHDIERFLWIWGHFKDFVSPVDLTEHHAITRLILKANAWFGVRVILG